MRVIGAEVEDRLDWIAASEALAAGHDLPPAQVTDSFIYRGADTLLIRSAWIDGLGIAVKTVTVFPENPSKNKPLVGGGVSVYADDTGELEAVIDFHLVTKWKTAADSLLSARHLARKDSRKILIVGAGNVAWSMIAAYSAAFPDAEFSVWNRTFSGASSLAEAGSNIRAVTDLPKAVAEADIIATTTMATEPVITGD